MAYPNLRAEMARKNVSVADMAELCECSTQSIYRKLNGVGDFRVWQAKRVCGLFPYVGFSYLFDEDEEGGEPNGPDSDNPAGG